MKYYPAYLDLRDRSCIVIGGGALAERKTLALLEAGADVTVISTTLTPKLLELSDSGKITSLQKKYEIQDINGAFLVIAATGSPEVDSSVAYACKKKHVLVNVEVSTEEGSFIVPSVVERGELLIAVSTNGVIPELARKIQQELETNYGPEFDLFSRKLMVVRKRMLEEIADENVRRKIVQTIVDSDVIELLRQGKIHEAELRIAEIAGLKHRS